MFLVPAAQLLVFAWGVYRAGSDRAGNSPRSRPGTLRAAGALFFFARGVRHRASLWGCLGTFLVEKSCRRPRKLAQPALRRRRCVSDRSSPKLVPAPPLLPPASSNL